MPKRFVSAMIMEKIRQYAEIARGREEITRTILTEAQKIIPHSVRHRAGGCAYQAP